MPVTRETIPLLKDRHHHPLLYACLSGALDLTPVSDADAAMDLLKKRAEPGKTNLVRGWKSGWYDLPKKRLDELPPVLICNLSLHAYLANTAMRETIAPVYADFAENIDDKMWVEEHLTHIIHAIFKLNPIDGGDIRDFYQNVLLPKGVGYAEDMAVKFAGGLDIYRNGDCADKTACWVVPELFSQLTPEQKSMAAGFKLFADGANGAKTAALSRPYLSGETGVLLYSVEELTAVFEAHKEDGLPFAVHAIGDQALDCVVEAVASFYASYGARFPVRMEHCQFISEKTARKAKELGMTLSMQPNFSFDSIMYRDRLDAEYLKNNNPFRMLIDKAGFVPGVDLIFGSDGMPDGARYALEQSLFPPFAGQRLSLDEFVAGYCLDNDKQGVIDLDVDSDRKTVSTRVRLY